MKSKALAVSSIPAMTEKRVQGCQLSGHCCSGGGDLMPKLLFLICVLGMPCASWAQTDRASWANLSALLVGQKIQVVEMNAKKHPGTFVHVSDTAISYQGTAGEQTIQKQDVRSVKLIKNKHRLRNTLIGLGVGGGVGAGIGAATFHSCSSQNFCIQPVGQGEQTGIAAVIGFAGGAAVGAVIGVLSPSHSTIYSVKTH
jgi:hypothetical protein